MTGQACIHRLDVTLWGCWLATGCRLGLVLCDGCPLHADVLGAVLVRTGGKRTAGNVRIHTKN